MLSVFVDMYGKAYVAKEPRSPLDSYVPYPSPILVALLLESKAAQQTHIDELRLEYQFRMHSATDEMRAEFLAAANDVIRQHTNGNGKDQDQSEPNKVA